MATFDTNHGGGATFYKFYVQNHTASTGLYYDIEMLMNGTKSEWRSGIGRGIASPGETVICNFDLYKSDINPLQQFSPEQLLRQTLEKASVSLFNVNDTPISLWFWSGNGNQQYINFLSGGPVRVTRDSSIFNEIKFNQYRFTLDSGGHNNDTLDIFFQLYDA
ncbi:hypothetical protein [Pseudomonas batumici]|uniref:hypothetical protein n=1 Tax=Pseudomonas batumici TaxID=226910 RepID=UPI000589E5AA|nr:hypothetical protein [Pseudomonas batumici]